MSDGRQSDYLDLSAPGARIGLADRLLEPVRWLFRWAGMTLLAVMIGLPMLQVILRQFLGRPFIGAEELTRFMLICVVFITLPYVISAGVAIRMEELLGALPRRLRNALRVAIPLVGAAGFAIAALSVGLATLRNLGNTTPTLNIPYWVFFLAALLGLLFAAIESALQAVKAWRQRPLYVTFAQEQHDEQEIRI
jgi:TRAP-type C4-dicarboxylate transport system permease small subunit